jgi:predicted ATPase
LAIELAAARVRTLRLPELASRLDEHLDVLTAGRNGRVQRHKTLHAALDWSWGLLDDDERTAFARLSVFAGGFDMAAANAVAAGTPLLLGRSVVDVRGDRRGRLQVESKQLEWVSIDRTKLSRLS